ncbi:MAG: hypothetical protein A2Z28_04825 [Chloroflexi bacterium RBG_16_51_9]|nr:MAG: hypothetical protein A2Z28_04825 [Chloroflexi bacterium RBG_16_51_9]
MKGIYLLLIELPEEQAIAVGSLGLVHFSRGYYAYVGSALGGFKSRLNRHLRKDKIPKWHIDYLLQKATIRSIIICETEERVECSIAQALHRQFEAIPRFGSSDCRCPSHLFFDTRKKPITEGSLAAVKSLSLEVRSFDAKTYRDVEA